MYEQSHIAEDSHSFLAIRHGGQITIYPFLTHSLFEAIGILRLNGFDQIDLQQKIKLNTRLQVYSHKFKNNRIVVKTLDDLTRQYETCSEYPLHCYVLIDLDDNQHLSYGIEKTRSDEHGQLLDPKFRKPLFVKVDSIQTMYSHVSLFSSKFTASQIIQHTLDQHGIVVEPIKNIYVDGTFIQYHANVIIHDRQIELKYCKACDQFNCECSNEELKKMAHSIHSNSF